MLEGMSRNRLKALQHIRSPRRLFSPDISLPFPHSPAQRIGLSVSLNLPHTMAAVNMDLIHFYQPPINTRLPGKGDGRPTVSDIPIVGGEDPNSTAFRPSHEPSGTFPDDVIEMIDLTASFNPSRERTPDLQDLEANVEGKSARSPSVN